MSNEAVRAILALPDPRRPDDPESGVPERQLRFLLALSTFARTNGSREAGIRLLAKTAHQSPTTASKARGELIRAGQLDYVRGRGRALSRYRIKVDGIADHRAAESASVVGTQASASVGGTQARSVEYQPGLRRVPTPPDLSTSPNSSTSANAAGSFKDLGHNPREAQQGVSGTAPKRPAKGLRDIRPIDVIKVEIQDRLGEAVTDEWAAKIEALLRARGVAHAGGFRAAIQREPNPRLAFLAQDGRHRPRLAVAAAIPAAPAEADTRSDEGEADDGWPKF